MPACTDDRKKRSRGGIAAGVAALLLAVPAGLLACGGERAAPAPEASDNVQSYTVRGVVARLPSPDRPPGRISIRHQEIPDFVGPSGEVVGMKAMTMDFELAQGVTTQALQPGDAIVFTFVVDWASDSLPRVTHLEASPADEGDDPSAAESEAPADPDPHSPPA